MRGGVQICKGYFMIFFAFSLFNTQFAQFFFCCSQFILINLFLLLPNFIQENPFSFVFELPVLFIEEELLNKEYKTIEVIKNIIKQFKPFNNFFMPDFIRNKNDNVRS